MARVVVLLVKRMDTFSQRQMKTDYETLDEAESWELIIADVEIQSVASGTVVLHCTQLSLP